jgi:5'-3' exonuclease
LTDRPNHLYDSIIVDISNRYYAASSVGYKTIITLDDGSSLSVGGIYITLRGIQKLYHQFLAPGGSMFYLFDRTMPASQAPAGEAPPVLRRLIDPDYKKSRKPREISFYRGLEMLYALLASYHDRSMLVGLDGYEADDFVKPIVDSLPSETRVLLVSTDLDWCRVLNNRIDILRGKDLFMVDNFLEKYGYDSSRVILYKSFRGDSDDVPSGVPGIREKDLIKIISEHNDLDDIKRSLSHLEYLSDTWKLKIIEGWSRIQLNYKLVDFLPLSIADLNASMVPCTFQPRALRAKYDMLGFNVETLDPRVSSEDYARYDTKKSSHFLVKRSMKRL